MEEIVKYFGNSFSEMGSSLTFLSIITISIMFIFKRPISEKIDKIRLRGKVIGGSELKLRYVRDLWSHDLFMTVESIKSKVDKIRFTTYGEYDVAKSKLLKVLIKNQLDVFYKRLKGYIGKDSIDGYDEQKLKYTLTEILKKGSIEYNEISRNSFVEMGVTEEDANFLINEYGYFRDEVQEGVFDRIDSITTNSNYYNNYDRLSAVFEVLAMGLYLIPKDSQAACNRINGRFKKYAEKI